MTQTIIIAVTNCLLCYSNKFTFTASIKLLIIFSKALILGDAPSTWQLITYNK